MSDKIGTGSGLQSELDCSARSELHRAVFIENEEKALEHVNSLLASGMNPNRQDRFGQSPVHLAARADRIGLLEALLAAGGCPLLGDLACLSAIDVAARFNSTHALRLFSTLLDSDVQQEDEPLKASLDFWRRGTVLVSIPNGGGSGSCSDASFYSCTSHTRNWVLSTAQYRGSGAMNASVDCSVCSVAAAQPDLLVNSGTPTVGAGSIQPLQAADSPHNVHSADFRQNIAMSNNLMELKFPEPKSHVQFGFKSASSRSVWFDETENNERQPRDFVVSDEEEKYILPMTPKANGWENFEGKQIFVKSASEDVYEYESSVGRDSFGATSLSKITEEKISCGAGMNLDELLPPTPVSLSEEDDFFNDQLKTTKFNSNLGMHKNQNNNELNNNSTNFTVTCPAEKLINTKSKSRNDDCITIEQNGTKPSPKTSVCQISSSVPSGNHRTDSLRAPTADNRSLSRAEYSLWEPSTLIEQDLNTAFLRSESFISFMNHTKYTNKSSSLFSGYSFYRDAEDEAVEKRNNEVVHREMNDAGRDCLPKQILKNVEVSNHSTHDGRLDACVYQVDSLPLKVSEFGVDGKSKQDVIVFDETDLKLWESNKEKLGHVPATSLTQSDFAVSSVIRRAPDECLFSQDVSFAGKKFTVEIEVFSQEQNRLEGKFINETEIDTHLEKAETPSVLVVGKPPKCGGKPKSSRKRSLGVVSHKLHSPQVGGKPKRVKQTEDHGNIQTTVVEFHAIGGSAAQDITLYADSNAAKVNTHSMHSVNEKLLLSNIVKNIEPPELNCNRSSFMKHHVTECTSSNCELKPSDGCSHAEKYRRLATPPLRRKFDLADTISCSSSSTSSQISVIAKENKHLKLLASVTKTPVSPSSLMMKSNAILNSGSKLQCTPNTILKCGRNALGSADVVTNRPGFSTVTAGNPRGRLTTTPSFKSKYGKLDIYSPKIPRSPIMKTQRPKIKQVLVNHLSDRYRSSTSPCLPSKQTATYLNLNLKSNQKNKVKGASTAPWRPPVSIVVTQATPCKRQKAMKAIICGKEGISRKLKANCNGLTKYRKELVGSRECLDEAIMEAVEGLDNESLKLVCDADKELDYIIGRSDSRNAEVDISKDAFSPIKRPMETADVEDEIPFGLTSAVFDLVRKFNAINGVGRNNSSKKCEEMKVPSVDTAEEVQRKAQCVSVPVQNLFVGSSATLPHTNIPNLNNLDITEDINENKSSSVPDNNLVSRNNVPGINSKMDVATQDSAFLTDAKLDYEASNDKQCPFTTNPNCDNLLVSTHAPCSDAKQPVHETCSYLSSFEGGAYKLPLPQSGASQPMPATSAHQVLSTTVPVSCTCPVLSTSGDVRLLKADTAGSTVGGSSIGSALTIVEEFVYSDPEHGVTLIERRCPSLASVSGTLRSLATTGSRGQVKTSDRLNETVGNVGSVLSSLHDSILRLSADTLSRELAAAGSALTGPVTETTARTYARLLHNIRHGKVTPPQLSQADGAHQYCRELRQALQDPDSVPWDSYRSLEQRMSSVFTSPRPLDFWRGGTAKVCFNYLLLDPTVMQDLPLRAASLSPSELFRVFVSAVFYVGKGCKARPYAHLYQALQEQDRMKDALANLDVSKLPSPSPTPPSSAEKVSRILRVWEAGEGVVSLHVFQHTIPAEAWTREAAMIDAIGLSNLSNCMSGSYYGPARGFPNCDRKALGVVLLHRAMLMLLCEGERQLRPPDLPPNPWANRTKKTKRTSPNLSP